MTWVIGIPTTFGAAIAYSDSRVTFSDSSQHDCLQKLHRVALQVVLGFAGSVNIGFEVLESYRRVCPPSDPMDPGRAIGMLKEVAKAVWAQASTEEKSLKCHLMLLAADPEKGDGTYTLTYACTMRSPEFSVTVIPDNDAGSIGADDPGCLGIIKKLTEGDRRDIWLFKLRTMTPRMAGIFMNDPISSYLSETKPGSISPFLNLFVVEPKYVTAFDLAPPETTPYALARSRDEYIDFCKSKGFSGAEAAC